MNWTWSLIIQGIEKAEEAKITTEIFEPERMKREGVGKLEEKTSSKNFRAH